MARRSTGNAYHSAGTWYARITLDAGKRRSFGLATCRTEEEARGRADVLAELAGRLRPLGQPELTARLLTQAAEGDELALGDVRRAVERLTASGLAGAAGPAPVTFKDLAERWLSGELAREHPDRVRHRRAPRATHSRIKTHAYPILGDMPLVSIRLDDAERVLSGLPAHLSKSTRRAVAGGIARVMRLAAYPCRLIQSSPIPKGFLPAVGPSKARGWLYPSEDRALLGCTAVPFNYRLLYGFLAREGMRRGEAERLIWTDIDLARGTVNLEKNKTDDPRLFALDPGVVRALRAVYRLRGEPAPNELIFSPAGEPAISFGKLAQSLREHLLLAGVRRPELFESTATRKRMRAHDLRATFITLNLAAGRTEDWIADRTGHRSSGQIRGYKRGARTAEELGLGPLDALDVALPELRPAAAAPPPPPAPPFDRSVKARIKARRSKNIGETSVRQCPQRTIGYVATERESALSSQIAIDARDRSAPFEAPRAFSGDRSAFSGEAPAAPPAATSRSASIAILTNQLIQLSAAGDNEAARVIHEAIGRLLAAPAPVTSEASPSSSSSAPPAAAPSPPGVVDLAEERRRRGDGSR